MPYSAEISRSNPTLFIFLIDRSASMGDPYGGGEEPIRKADALADAINRLLQNLCLRCAKEKGVLDYFYIDVIGYGDIVGPSFAGTMQGRSIIPISEIASNPARVETRTKKVSDGAGGLVDQTVKFPIWFEPVASGGTPMCDAFAYAETGLTHWLRQYPKCYPPIVMNITDGESTDGDPTNIAARITSMSSDDGPCLLFNAHLSSQNAMSVHYPSNEDYLPNEFAKMLFRISSRLPQHMLQLAMQSYPLVTEGARGFVFNAGLVSTIKFLDIGTRPANLR